MSQGCVEVDDQRIACRGQLGWIPRHGGRPDVGAQPAGHGCNPQEKATGYSLMRIMNLLTVASDATGPKSSGEIRTWSMSVAHSSLATRESPEHRGSFLTGGSP